MILRVSEEYQVFKHSQWAVKSTAFALLVLLAGCQSLVRTDISTFRDDRVALGKGSIVVQPISDEQRDSLEYQYFKTKLESKLISAGYSLASASEADYSARLDYGVNRQEADQRYDRGRIVHVGGHIGHHANHSSVILSSNDGPEFEYVREVSLRIQKAHTPSAGDDDTNGSNRVLEIRATSEGRCEHLTVVFDEILVAIFDNIRRANGSVEHVRVKGDARCPS